MVGRTIDRKVARLTARWVLPVLLLILATACESQPPTPTVTPPLVTTTRPTVDPTLPPEIDFASATTYPDGPPVADERFAGVLIVENGDVRLFDDIGRMVTYQMLSSQGITGVWVRDYEHDRWIAAEDATFVGSTNLVTPRGSGLLAVDSVERALLLVLQLNGRTLTYDEIAPYMVEGLTDPPMPVSGGPGLGGLLVVDDGK